MPLVSRRQTVAALAACAVSPAAALASAPRPEWLVLVGMPATPSVLLARAIASGALAPFVTDPALRIWGSLDELRAGVGAGTIDVFAAPTDICAAMFNRGVPIRLLHVLAWGLLYVLSRDPAVRRVEDLAGRRVVLAFRGEAPDLILRLVLRRLGMNPDQDVTLAYVATPAETSRRFLAGDADIAVVPEPVGTAVELAAERAGAPVHRVADLTEVHGRLSGRPAGLPKAGLGVSERLVQARPELVLALHAACVASATWVRDNPAAAGVLGAAPLGMPAAVIERSLPRFRLAVVAAHQARPELESYFTELMEMSPEVLCGRLPAPLFYREPEA